MSNQSKTLSTAIVFSAMIISASLIFLALQTAPASNPAPASETIAAEVPPAPTTAPAESDSAAQNAAQNVKKVSQTEDHIRGNVDAEISLIEYSDFECPFCKRFHPTANQVIEAYDGKVNWVYRQFPLSFHEPLASMEASASECVAELGGNDKFWEYADKIFETTTSNGNGLSEEDLVKMATEVGVNKSKFQSCLASEKYSEKIRQSLDEGILAGIDGTPGNILLNNKTGEAVPVIGAQPFSAFQSAIDQMLQ